MSRHHTLQEAVLLWSKATLEQKIKALELLRKDHAAKKYPLPESVSDLVEDHIRNEAFELEAITKSIFSWAVDQEALPRTGSISDMDVGDIVSLSSMAVQRVQRIISLANEFESKVTSVGVKE